MRGLVVALALSVLVSASCASALSADEPQTEPVAATSAPTDAAAVAAPSDATATPRAPTDLPAYEAGVVIINEVPHGVIIPSVLWRFGTHKAGMIPVCWEQTPPHYRQERDWVQAAIANTWQRHSGLTFGGWQRCPSTASFQGIRIEVVDEDDSPRVEAFGQRLRGLRNGVELNFVFARFQAECCISLPGGWPYEDCTAPANRRNCIESSAIHEFGHAIGLAHEQRHPDTPTSCRFISHLGVDEVVTTARFDPLSVMNYCRQDRMRALQLSAFDIRTVQALYCTRGVTTCPGYALNMLVD